MLLGPSGCGKSTTLNMIAGLEELTDGEIWFDDQLMNDVPPHKRDVAMVFQSYALYPHKTVYENIAFGLRMRSMPDAEIAAGCATPPNGSRSPICCSAGPASCRGGQRQRVALGRAMVRQPHGLPDGRAAVQPRRRAAALHARR